MKPTKTWILIADGARARVLENDGPGKGLIAIDRLVLHGDHAATHDANTNPHRELKRTFAHHLADVLADELDAGSYERLVIVAAPVTLGDLRKVLAPQVAAKIPGEVNKDLTKIPNGDVAHHLEDVLVT
jgi:protein required for attachment to host cells